MTNRKILTEYEFYMMLEDKLPGDDLPSEGEASKPRVYFTRLSLSGLKDMHEYSVSDERFYKYLEYEPFKSIDETEAYLKRLMDLDGDVEGRSNIGWFIRNVEDNRVIGIARFVNIDYNRQSVSWGYGLDPKLWGQGYVQEIQKALLDYIFERLCLNRLYGSAMLDNKQTISTLRSIGMKEEGTHRQSMRDYKGTYYNSWSYGMLYEDYKNSRACLPTNINSRTLVNEKIINNDTEQVEVLLKEFLHEYGKVDEDFEFCNLPFWDSFKQVELVVFLETRLGIVFTTENIRELNAIRSIKKLVSTF